MRTADRVLAFVCAVTAVFALSFAAGRILGPVGYGEDRPPPVSEHGGDQGADQGGTGDH